MKWPGSFNILEWHKWVMVSTASAERELCTLNHTPCFNRSPIQNYCSDPVSWVDPTTALTGFVLQQRKLLPAVCLAIWFLWIHLDYHVTKSLANKLRLRQHRCRLLLSCWIRPFPSLTFCHFSWKFFITSTTTSTKNWYKQLNCYD